MTRISDYRFRLFQPYPAATPPALPVILIAAVPFAKRMILRSRRTYAFFKPCLDFVRSQAHWMHRISRFPAPLRIGMTMAE
jgi:hypothetical protein